MHEDELRGQIAELVAVQGPLRRQLAPVPVVNQPVPGPRPHQWVYTRELRVEDGIGKPFTNEHWVRVDGRKSIRPIGDRRAAKARDVRKERSSPPLSRCPGQPARIRPAVGLGAFFPDPSAVPTDPDGLLAAVYQLVEDPACAPIAVGDTVQDRAFMLIDGMLQTVMPVDVRAALAQALTRIPGVTVVPGASDAAGRRGVAVARAAAIEGPGSADWLRLDLILDGDSHRYLGARYVVTRDHRIPNVGPWRDPVPQGTGPGLPSPAGPGDRRRPLPATRRDHHLRRLRGEDLGGRLRTRLPLFEVVADYTRLKAVQAAGRAGRGRASPPQYPGVSSSFRSRSGMADSLVVIPLSGPGPRVASAP
jgi:hypothetical protein